MQRYDRKVALISGGLGAMGLGIARRLISEGARVVLGDVAVADLDQLRAAFEGAAPPDQVHLDVTQAASWQRAIDETLARHGRLDLVVNNAGVLPADTWTFDEIPLEDWERVFSVNVNGVLLGTQAAIRSMKASPDGGAIVNLGSVASFVGSRDAGAYGASKAAVRNMTRQAALSVARQGIPVRVNAVHPGYVWTPLVERKLVGLHGSLEAAQTAVRAMNPLQRIVEVADVAAAVAFLGSPDARMVTGADLIVDGGRLIQ